MEYEELKNIVKSQKKFKKFLIDLLKNTKGDPAVSYPSGVGAVGTPNVTWGYNDGYYWDYTKVQLNDDDTLDVTFDVGSGSGYKPTQFKEFNVSIEDFRQYLINRKWKDGNINTLELLCASISIIEGSKLIDENNEE